MKILMVNKFLHPNGGSETYMFRLGEYLQSQGHTVEYFGMAHEERMVGNSAGCYVRQMDFHKNSVKNLAASLKTIYSWEARRKIRIVLEDFKPDIVHLNNVNFQLTPSIYYEIKKHRIPMVQTVHDPQIACPCHRLFIEQKQLVCTECLGGKYRYCFDHCCVAGSRLKSLIAALESWYYHRRHAYDLVDTYICPSGFMANVLRQSGVRGDKLQVLCNFPSVDPAPITVEKKNYVLYFGRYSVEKGLRTLLEACRKLPDIPFLFAGAGPLEDELAGLPNVTNLGFQTGDALRALISAAAFSVYPSVWYENCPLSVLESQALGTPVLGSDIGGIPELITPGKTGELFRSGHADDLAEKIALLFYAGRRREAMREHCLFRGSAVGIGHYYARLIAIYAGAITGLEIIHEKTAFNGYQ
jgi:glycosyltransferase involved in cell wall biosynthesis